MLAQSSAALANSVSPEWNERGEYWLEHLNPPLSYQQRIARRLHLPLILSGHGVKLKIDRGTLFIRNGFTHYPQAQEEYRFFPRDKRLPSRIIILDSSGNVSFDALEWLAEQYIPLIQLNWRGEALNVFNGVGYGADPQIAYAQLSLQHIPQGFEFAKWLIQTKIENCKTTIGQVFTASPIAEITINKLELKRKALADNPPSTVSKLLGAEGPAAATYFRSWHNYPLRWSGTSKSPIPEEWHKIGPRMADGHSNNNARHPVNAMLNYAYAMLECQVRLIILSMGFDPNIGYIHVTKSHKSALIFDLMEPIRPIVERYLLLFLQNHVFSPNDFILNGQGVCRLHPQFARVVVRLAQDIKEVETTIIGALNKLLALHPTIINRAQWNAGSLKAKKDGKKCTVLVKNKLCNEL